MLDALTKRISVVAILALAALLLGAPAHAFMLQGMGGNSGNGSNFSDPDEEAPIQKLTNPPGNRDNGIGGSGMHFGFSVNGDPSGFNGSRDLSGSRNYFDPSQPPPMRPFSSFNSNPFGYGRGPFGNSPR
ncbi:MAG TPA: hypothetical protein VKY65_10745 [Alphaproteobacteria bacterium]|nr:hypothetical protein [Alphaproteobacteria bacterium]